MRTTVSSYSVFAELGASSEEVVVFFNFRVIDERSKYIVRFLMYTATVKKISAPSIRY